MNAREAILKHVRHRIGGDGSDELRRATVEKRLKAHPKGILPKVADGREALIAAFSAKVANSSATVETVKAADLGKAISAFLRNHNLPQRLRLGDDRRLAAIAWPGRDMPELLHGPSDGNDLAGLSHAACGVAETGTLILLSGPDNPSTVNFLPENHIVVVDATDIEANFEGVWTRIRRRYGAGSMPRTVNLVTGPSRSADIEQTLILGAHGPVRLHVLIVEG